MIMKIFSIFSGKDKMKLPCWMIYLVVCVCVMAQRVEMSATGTANSTCHNADWWISFDHQGWSKCPVSSPYINGLWRSKTSSGRRDWIFLLEEASCCDNGTVNVVCVQADWVKSFDIMNSWNSCPSGYYLSGLYRSESELGSLHHIDYAWCCKPSGAPDSYKTCYDEDITLSFDWDKEGMVSCSRSGYYVTGLYKSDCDRLYCIETLRCCKLQAAEIRGLCQNANWWLSFNAAGWSKCPSTSPYISGLYRQKAPDPNEDLIYLLKDAMCCNISTWKPECTQADSNISISRSYNWNTCPSGYYLSGLYRSGGNELNNITHAWCCKPSGAPNSYKECYNEDVSLRFEWHQMGMVSCYRSGYYITGFYKSSCDYLYCIDKFRCCKLQVTEGCPFTGARESVQVNAVPSNTSVKFTWAYEAGSEDKGLSLSISGSHPAKKMNITVREYIFHGLEPNKTYNYSYTIFYGKGCKTIAATDTFTTSPDFLEQVSNSDKPGGKSEEKSLNIGAVIGGVTGGIIFLIVIVILFLVRRIIIRKQRQRSIREFNAMRHLENPHQNVYNLPPQQPLLKREAKSEDNKDQAEELSYIVLLENWDIPPDNLKVLDRKLGGGQFGIVKQGLLTTGKGDPEVVAVKTVKGLHLGFRKCINENFEYKEQRATLNFAMVPRKCKGM